MNYSLDIASLRRLYQSGELTPLTLVDDLLARLAGEDAHHIWISRLEAAALRTYASNLEGKDIASLPLYGIPFVIKDNKQQTNQPTTTTRPENANQPKPHATNEQRQNDAEAFPLGFSFLVLSA